MRKIFIYLLFVFSVGLSASEISWAKDFNEGMQEAARVNKPVLFVSSRHTCKYCVILEDTTFKDKEVIAELNKEFVSIVAYSDEQDYMPKELWQPGTPAIWFLYPNGQPMFQPLMGAVDAKNFLEALKIVKEDFNKRKNVK
ncbi:thioredoxin family protein [Candidatus Sulfurimonas marisnigri]|uniref:Thioredoxin family protein n=1 Tax=Candidatus Sulfurimonas marisnigri TaxID=2740405 RepID=A0A7S7M105_9BACT|nr:DUF255 domain-containing protein [Candidatus Sulfurimonas marisnigri]QOY55096.1 thioredoxin family protein [Candidatus Sulfurimonas marisnigri]